MKVTIEQLVGYLRQRGHDSQWLRTHPQWITAYNRMLEKNHVAIEEALKPLNEDQQEQAVLMAFFSHPDDFDIKVAVKQIQSKERPSSNN